MNNFENIKSLISNNEIKEACSTLRRYAISGRTLNEILLQESKYNQLERDIRNGVISDDHGSKERNKIVHNLLQIADNVNQESLGQIREQPANKQFVPDSTDTIPDKEKEHKDALYKAGDDFYNDAIYYIGNDKRRAHGGCVYASIYYRYITQEYPDKSYGFLCLANTLKVLYLLNYNKYRTDKKYDEIVSCVERGKKVDKGGLYNDALELVLTDIKEYIRKEKTIKVIHFTCIPLVALSLIDAFFLNWIFDVKNESLSNFIVIGFVVLLIYAFMLDEKKKKHIVRN